MKRREKAWFWRPEKSPKPKVPDNVKAEIETKANELVESFLKPEYIKPPPEDIRFNYAVDIYEMVPQLLLLLCEICLSQPRSYIPLF